MAVRRVSINLVMPSALEDPRIKVEADNVAVAILVWYVKKFCDKKERHVRNLSLHKSASKKLKKL